MATWLQRDWCLSLVLALGHFLWQGTLIAIVLAIALRVVNAVSVRYWVSLAALLLMAASPFATLGWLLWPVSHVATFDFRPVIRKEAKPIQPVDAEAHVADITPFSNELPQSDPIDLGPREPVASPVPQSGPFEERSWWQRFAPQLTTMYLCGVGLMLLRLAIGLWGGRRLRRRTKLVTDSLLLGALQRQAEALGMKLRPVLAYCEQVTVPTIVGVLKPMILLPVTLSSGLSPEQIESVLAHELAHLRRYDHLINLLQRVIESLLFFHPVVWWVSNRIRDEREHCCDDLVVACGTMPLDYAKSLLRVAELSQKSRIRRSVSAVSLLATGGKPSNLRQRIARLLGESTTPSLRISPRVLMLAIGMPLVALIVMIQSAVSGHRPTSSPNATDDSLDLHIIHAANVTTPPSDRDFDRLLVSGKIGAADPPQVAKPFKDEPDGLLGRMVERPSVELLRELLAAAETRQPEPVELLDEGRRRQEKKGSRVIVANNGQDRFAIVAARVRPVIGPEGGVVEDDLQNLPECAFVFDWQGKLITALGGRYGTTESVDVLRLGPEEDWFVRVMRFQKAEPFNYQTEYYRIANPVISSVRYLHYPNSNAWSFGPEVRTSRFGTLYFDFPNTSDKFSPGEASSTLDGVPVNREILWDGDRNLFVGALAQRAKNKPLYQVDADWSKEFQPLSPKHDQLVVTGGRDERQDRQHACNWSAIVPDGFDAAVTLTIPQHSGPPDVVERRIGPALVHLTVEAEPQESERTTRVRLWITGKVEVFDMPFELGQPPEPQPMIRLLNPGNSAQLLSRPLKSSPESIRLEIKLLARELTGGLPSKPAALSEVPRRVQVAMADLKAALRIRGRVLDAQTGKVIEKIRMVPTSVSRDDAKDITWQTQYLKEFTDGRFVYETERPWDKTKLRIEAEGYRPATTRVVNKGETVEVDVKLVREVFAGVVRLPNGQPAAKAQLALASWTNEIAVRSSKLSYSGHGAKLRKIVETDEHGRFVMPAEIDPWVVVVAHEAGYAEVSSVNQSLTRKTPVDQDKVEDKPKEDTAVIDLQPWGHVKGRVLMGDRPVVGAKYWVYPARNDDVHVQASHNVVTDAEGRFVIEQIPPSRFGICQRYAENSDGQGGHSISGLLVRFDIPAGKTTTLELGGRGRTLIGKLALPEGFPHKIDWSKVSLRISLQAPRFGRSFGRIGGDNGQGESWSKFLQTDEGKLYGRMNVAIAADGSFRIEGLPAAEYDLAVSANGQAVVGEPKPDGEILRGSQKVPVPAVAPGAAEAIDLGTIDLKSLVALTNKADAKADGAAQARKLPLEFRIAANLPEDGWKPVLPEDWEQRNYRDGRLPAGKDHDAGFVWYPLSQPWRSDAAFVVSKSTPETDTGNELLQLLSDKPEHGMLMDGSWSVLEAKVVRGKRNPAPGENLGYAIEVRLDEAGQKRFAELVSSYRDMSLAVLMNDEIVGKLVLKKPSARLVFGGHFTKEWAEELVRQLHGLPPDSLATQFRFHANSVTLQEVFGKILPEIAQRAGRKLSVDFDTLKAAGVPMSKIVTISVRDESLRQALERVLKESDTNLDYRLSDDGKDLIVFAPPGETSVGTSAPRKGLEFLTPYPKLHGLSLDMTEKQFLEIVKQQQELTTRKTVEAEKITHHIALGDGHTLFVMFDKDARCSGIQRVRGEDKPR